MKPSLYLLLISYYKKRSWKDNWLGEGLLKDQVPVLYRLVRLSGILLADYFSIAGWNFQFQEGLNDFWVGRCWVFFLSRMQFVVLDMHKDDDMFLKASKNGHTL